MSGRTSRKYFMTIEEWYNDRYLYHLIGYLVNEGKSITELKKDADNCESKREFRHVLKAKIFKSLFDDDQQSLDKLGGDKLRDSLKDHLANWDYDGNKSKIVLHCYCLISQLLLLTHRQICVFNLIALKKKVGISNMFDL